MWKWIILVLLVLVVAAMVYASATQSEPVDLAAARRGTMSAYVEERATTRLPQTTRITMPIDGRIMPITLEVGDRVTADQIVARLEPADLDTAVARAEANVKRLQARIVESNDTRLELSLLEGVDHELVALDRTVEASRARTEASEAKEAFRREDLARLEQAFSADAASETELDRARLDDIEARVDHRMDVLILRAIEAYREAARILPRAVRQYIDKKALAEAVLHQELADADAALDLARRNRDRGGITSPVEGIVLERYVTNRRVLPAGEALLDIGRLEDLEVEAEVLSEDAVEIVVGDAVDIFGPSIGREPIAGTVSRIEPRGFTKISSLGVEQQRVPVIVDFEPGMRERLDESGRQLGVGYRVRVRIHTDRADDAVIVPRSALFRGPAQRWQAFAIREGRARLVDLEVGLMNEAEAQILSGLSAGDQVILAPETSLEDGDRVEGR